MSLTWQDWLLNDRYFDDLAVLGVGPLHPGGLRSTERLLRSTEWTGLSVLDVGCGNGWTLARISEAGANIRGVEPSPFMRLAAERNGVSAGQLIDGTVEGLSLSTGSYDRILVAGVLGFVSDAYGVVRELANSVAVPGGLLIVIDWVSLSQASSTRTSRLPEGYGFTLAAGIDQDTFSQAAQSAGLACRFELYDAPTSRRMLGSREAFARASLFFPDAPHRALKEAVDRKLALMGVALAITPPEQYFIAWAAPTA